jgi:putative SOS response-associated peptidase YedK
LRLIEGLDMCGRYTLANANRIVEVIQNITLKVDLAAEVGRWNIAPSQEVLIVTARAGPTLEKARWGLIPRWAKDAAIGNRLINARAETLQEKPAFREALAQRRCGVLADGFYEWRKNKDGGKTPMYIRLKSRQPFAFGGLWETWHDPAGSDVTSCTIITTQSNRLVASIHDRMPAMFTLEELPKWLVAKPEEVGGLLRPFDAGEMETYEVGKLVNNPKNDTSGCAAPAGPEASGGAEPEDLFTKHGD